MSRPSRTRTENCGRRRIWILASVWASVFLLQSIVRPGDAATQGAPSQDSTRPVFKLGGQKRSNGNAFTVALDFSSKEEVNANQIRAEIILPQRPWRFRKAQAVAGSSLKVSAKQRREKRVAPGGAEQDIVVLSLTVSSGKAAISPGTVAELLFTREGPEVSSEIPLVIRSYEIGSPDSPSASQSPLEPPSAEPPANPAPTCFFFTH